MRDRRLAAVIIIAVIRPAADPLGEIPGMRRCRTHRRRSERRPLREGNIHRAGKRRHREGSRQDKRQRLFHSIFFHLETLLCLLEKISFVIFSA